MKINIVKIAGGGVSLGALLLSGCASNLSSVQLAATPSVAGASVQVDVIGVGPQDQSVADYPVGRYWEQGGSVAEGAPKKSFRFGPGEPEVQAISAGDPIWKQWQSSGVKELLVIADLPGVFPDVSPDMDPRRKILPIASKKPAVTVSLDRTGLNVATQ
jgi:hypothetical protein